MSGGQEGLEGLFFGLSAGLSAGLIFGLFFGLIGGLTSEQIEETTYPGQRLKQTILNSSFSTLIVGLMVGLIVGLMVGLSAGLMVGLSTGLAFGLIAGLMVGLSFGYIPLIQHCSLRLVLAQHHMLPRKLIAFLEHAVGLIFLRRVGGVTPACLYGFV